MGCPDDKFILEEALDAGIDVNLNFETLFIVKCRLQ